MDKEMRKVIKALKAQGFDVLPTKSGHYTVRTKDGKRVTTLAGSASDHRSMKNALADVRRFVRMVEEAEEE
jgi:predicted RNA binding protein YcfA (HicA-like mRNA interferase family)